MMRMEEKVGRRRRRNVSYLLVCDWFRVFPDVVHLILGSSDIFYKFECDDW